MNNTKTLAKILSSVTPRRSNLQVLYNFAVQGGQAMATDLDAAEVVVSGVEAPDGIYNTSLFQKSLNFRAAILDGYDLSEFPPSQYKREFKKHFAFDTEVVRRAVEIVDFTSKDFSVRIPLTGMAIEKDGIVATDGHRLANIKMDTAIEGDGVIFPAKGLAIVQTILKAKYELAAVEFHWEPADGSREVNQGSFKLLFRGEDWLELCVRAAEGPYPTWAKVLPDKDWKHEKFILQAKDTAILKASIEKINPMACKGITFFHKGHLVAKNNGKVYATPSLDLPTIGVNAGYLKQILGFIGDDFTLCVPDKKLSTITFEKEEKFAILMPLRTFGDNDGVNIEADLDTRLKDAVEL